VPWRAARIYDAIPARFVFYSSNFPHFGEQASRREIALVLPGLDVETANRLADLLGPPLLFAENLMDE
jgi:hypothetical protein